MKFISRRDFDLENAAVQRVFLLNNINLQKTETEEGPLIEGDERGAHGSLPEDNVKNFENRISAVVQQGVDNTTSAALSGSYLSRVMTPPEFQNFGFYALNPFFAFPAGFTPARVLGRQIREGFDRIGDVSQLLGNSPLLSVKMVKALAGKKTIDTTIKGMQSGGGRLSEMTLTSLSLISETVDESYSQIQATNEDRAVEFFSRSGQNLETGERDEETGVVWWKRAGMFLTAQRPLYRLRYRMAKARYKEGYDEARSNLRKLTRQKEEQVFKLQQKVDSFLFPAEGEADTKRLNEGRKVVHKIINNPERFLSSPDGFSVGSVGPRDIFGEKFNALDVVETLRAPKYEFLTNKEDENNYLDSAITTNNWKLNHYNTLRNLGGFKVRRNTLDQFEGTGLRDLENHVNKVYEPSGNNALNLDNPEELVNRLKNALGSATPGLRKEVQELIFSDIYIGNMEVFWYLAKYLGENLNVFDKLPKDLQQEFAEFFLRKREQLEEPLVSGSISEEGTVMWRAQVLRQGKNVIQSVKNVANLLPEIGNKLLSFKKGEAQGALQELKSVMDSYKFLNDILGTNGNKDETNKKREELLKKLPELEQGLLKNIFSMEPFIKRLDEQIYPNLKTQRDEFQKKLDVVTSERMEKLQEDYDTAQEVYKKAIESGKSGFETARPTADLPQYAGQRAQAAAAGDGDVGGGFTAGVDIETIPTTAQRNYAQLRDLLYGKTGTEEKGLIGQLNQVLNYTYDLPGDISGNILDIANQSEKLITSRLREIGVSKTGEEVLDNLKDSRRDIDFLARLDLGDRASKDIEKTARALLANATIQQFENMKRAKYGELQDFSYMPADFQSRLTVKGVCEYKTMTDLLFVREDADGSVWYHSKTQIIKVSAPRFGENAQKDERNVQVWDKHSTERGYGYFTVPQTNPHLGIMITSNPENSAAIDNPYYGVVDKKIDDLKK